MERRYGGCGGEEGGIKRRDVKEEFFNKLDLVGNGKIRRFFGL